MNVAAWVERNGRRLREAPAIAEGERVHATWSAFAMALTGAWLLIWSFKSRKGKKA